MRIFKLLFPPLVLSLVVAILVIPSSGFYIKPYLNNITPDGVTIMWETGAVTGGAIDYGVPGGPPSSATETQPSKIHKIRITGLMPDTVYAYKVRSGPEDTFEATFKTAPTDQRPIAFAVIGDSRRWGDRWQETEMSRHMMQWEPEFVVNTGDLVLKGHKYRLWADHFKRFNGLMSRMMMITVRGNHEGSRTADAENDWFAKYHEFPGRGEPFFSFDWGNTHFIGITMDELIICLGDLEKDLAQNNKKYTIVSFHSPIYCAGYFGPTDDRKETSELFKGLRATFDKYSVTAHFAGHTHIYERSWPIREGKRRDSGITYFVQGGDINGNFPEWWTAVADDRTRYAQPTYTMVWCKDDRFETRTFAWSIEQQAVVEIDHTISWKDEAVPAAVLTGLPGKTGAELAAAIEELGAMQYAPAVEPLRAYLEGSDQAVRRAAATAIRAIGSEEGAEAVLAYVKDPDPVVAVQAARALEAAMPERLTGAVAQLVGDSRLDPEVRCALIGALQLRASGEEANKAVLDVLASGAPSNVRDRASYAATRLVDKSDIGTIVKLVEQERQEYVLIRLAYTLNKLTGAEVALDQKKPLAKSSPGRRKDFVEEWIAAK